MRLIIGLAAFAVLGCSATDMMLFSTTMTSINTSILAMESVTRAERCRQHRLECQHCEWSCHCHDECQKQ